MAKPGRNSGRVVTRAQAAKLLDVHKSSVRRAEQRGELRPRVDAYGVRWFEEDQVRALAQRQRRRGLRAQVTISGRVGAALASLIGLSWPFDEVALFERLVRLREQVRETQRAARASSAAASPVPAAEMAAPAPATGRARRVRAAA
jgi:hypothetical protein